MKRLLKFAVLCAFVPSFAGQLGINISLPERGGTFVDITKENYRWSKVGTGAALGAGDVDSSGLARMRRQFRARFAAGGRMGRQRGRPGFVSS